MGEQRALSFGSAAHRYEAGRPEYPRDAASWLLEPVASGAVRVADVGAGTGKFTRVLHGLSGVEVIAVEPDSGMLDALQVAVPGVETALGHAEDLPLEAASVDAVTMAQAWHWAEPVAASREIGRVVRPGGVLGLIWNVRDDSVSWVKRLGEIMDASDLMTRTVQGVRIAAPFGEPEQASWEWTQRLTTSQLHDMVASRSYVITASEERKRRITAEVNELLTDVERDDDGRIAFPYRTVAFRSVREH